MSRDMSGPRRFGRSDARDAVLDTVPHPVSGEKDSTITCPSVMDMNSSTTARRLLPSLLRSRSGAADASAAFAASSAAAARRPGTLDPVPSPASSSLQAGYRAGDIDSGLGREAASPAPASPLGPAARTAAAMEREMDDGIRVFHASDRAVQSGATVEMTTRRPVRRRVGNGGGAENLPRLFGQAIAKDKSQPRSTSRYEAARLGHGREAERIDAILPPGSCRPGRVARSKAPDRSRGDR